MSLGIAKINRLSLYTAPAASSGSSEYDLSGYTSNTYSYAGSTNGSSINHAVVFDDTYAVGLTRKYVASGTRTGVEWWSRSGNTVSYGGVLADAGTFTAPFTVNQTSWTYSVKGQDDDVYVFTKSSNTIYVQRFYSFNFGSNSVSISGYATVTTSFSTDPISITQEADGTWAILGGIRDSSVRRWRGTISGTTTLSVSQTSNTTHSLNGNLVGVSKRDDDDYLVMSYSSTTTYGYTLVSGTLSSATSKSGGLISSTSAWIVGGYDTTDASTNSHRQIGDTVWTFSGNGTVSDTMSFRAAGYNETDGWVTHTFTNDTDPNSRAGGWGNVGYGTMGTTDNGNQMIFLNRYGANQIVIVDKTSGDIANFQVNFGGAETYSTCGTWGDGGYLVHGSSGLALLY